MYPGGVVPQVVGIRVRVSARRQDVRLCFELDDAVGEHERGSNKRVQEKEG